MVAMTIRSRAVFDAIRIRFDFIAIKRFEFALEIIETPLPLNYFLKKALFFQY